MRDFGNDVFAGTSKYYANFRAPYPPEIFPAIARIFDLDGHSPLLDLGCGAGKLAIPLAKYFDQIIALDPNVEMLKEAHKKADTQRNINIKWN
jgi:cyclopropane fatty-acyl-phospholipid synthase-like methyltransferase